MRSAPTTCCSSARACFELRTLGATMTLIQVLRILWARRRLFVLLLALVVGAVMAASLLAPRKYVAQAALLIDTRGNEMLAEPGIAPQMLPAHLNTQAQIIASRRTALKVVDTHE